METNNFYNNGSFNDKAMGLIKNGAYLADMAYKNRKELKKVSLNPDAKDDEIIIIQNQGISSQRI